VAVISAQVHHGGDPFQGPGASAENGHPAAGRGVVDATAVSDGGVKTPGECDRRCVGDLVLHGGDSADPAAHKGGRRARKQILRAGRGPGAGIEHDQPRHRAGLMQQVNQAVGLNPIGAAVVADQRQTPLIPVAVEVAVANEVHHVPLIAQQEILHGRPGCLGRPAHID